MKKQRNLILYLLLFLIIFSTITISIKTVSGGGGTSILLIRQNQINQECMALEEQNMSCRTDENKQAYDTLVSGGAGSAMFISFITYGIVTFLIAIGILGFVIAFFEQIRNVIHKFS